MAESAEEIYQRALATAGPDGRLPIAWSTVRSSRGTTAGLNPPRHLVAGRLRSGVDYRRLAAGSRGGDG